MDSYKIGVSIALANGVSPILAIIGRDLTHLNTSISKIEKSFGKWAVAIGGVAGILGGTAIIGGLVAIAKHGGDVNHQLELMKIAGMDNADIQASLAQAMKTTGSVMTTTLSENLAHIRELRYAFGETSTAMLHLDEISKANMVLNGVKGGGKDQVWELVKSLEQKGLTYKPEEFSSYVNTMTKVIEATGGKVTPEMFMSTFKYGRTSMLGWDEGFVGGALPRLMQSMATGGGGGGSGGGGPGNALMSAFAKVVQGQMPKKAAEEWERMGLAPGGVSPIEGSSQSLVGDITSKDLFMKNPYEWVQKVLMPALAAKGITAQNDIIEEVSKMFPVRTASQVISEMALQGRYHEGEKSPFEKDIALQHGAMGLPGGDELAKNDYPTLLREFNAQFRTLLEALGSPLMQPGGPVMSAMAGLTNTLNSMAQFAAVNPEAIRAIGYTVAAIGAVFVLAGGIALASLAAVPLAISAIVVAIGAFITLEWDTFKTAIGSVRDALASFFSWLGGIAEKIKGLFPGGEGAPQLKKDLDEANKLHVPLSFTPGPRETKPTPISLSLNVDGRTLAQTLSEELEELYEHATGSPNYNGRSQFGRADGGISGV